MRSLSLQFRARRYFISSLYKFCDASPGCLLEYILSSWSETVQIIEKALTHFLTNSAESVIPLRHSCLFLLLSAHQTGLPKRHSNTHPCDSTQGRPWNLDWWSCQGNTKTGSVHTEHDLQLRSTLSFSVLSSGSAVQPLSFSARSKLWISSVGSTCRKLATQCQPDWWIRAFSRYQGYS